MNSRKQIFHIQLKCLIFNLRRTDVKHMMIKYNNLLTISQILNL